MDGDEKRALVALHEVGVTEQRHLPAILKDRVVARSKKGPAGAIIVRKMDGVVNNTAKALVKQFEMNTGGRDDIIEKLEAAKGDGALKEGDLRLLELLRTSTKNKSMARMIAEAKTEPLGLMRAYARGCVVLGQVQAAIEAHNRLPVLVKDIFRHAIDKEVVCQTCVGSGKISFQKDASTVTMESKICPGCNGDGSFYIVSKNKEFATKVAMEMTGQIKGPSGPTVNVQQNVVNAGGNVGFMDQLLKVSEKVLFGKTPPASSDIVEAEVVQ